MLNPRHAIAVIASGCSALLLLWGCDEPAAQMSDEELGELQEWLPGMTRACVEKVRLGGVAAIADIDVDECFEMDGARNWHGIWRNDFEGSGFCPQPANACGYDAPGDKIWLSYSRHLRQQGAEPPEGDDGLYKVKFIGRRTAVRGHHGHTGSSDYEIVVDRLISVRPIEESEIP